MIVGILRHGRRIVIAESQSCLVYHKELSHEEPVSTVFVFSDCMCTIFDEEKLIDIAKLKWDRNSIAPSKSKKKLAIVL